MNGTVIIGLLLSGVGTILVINNWIRFFRKLIERIWPEWREIERAIAYLGNKGFLTLCEREIFLPFQEYFCRKTRRKGIFGFRLNGPYVIFRGVHGTLESEFEGGENWNEFVRKFHEEKGLFFEGI